MDHTCKVLRLFCIVSVFYCAAAWDMRIIRTCWWTWRAGLWKGVIVLWGLSLCMILNKNGMKQKRIVHDVLKKVRRVGIAPHLDQVHIISIKLTLKLIQNYDLYKNQNIGSARSLSAIWNTTVDLQRMADEYNQSPCVGVLTGLLVSTKLSTTSMVWKKFPNLGARFTENILHFEFSQRMLQNISLHLFWISS